MIVTLNPSEGYDTGNKNMLIEHPDTSIQLSPVTNSFAWDVKLNDGDYQISLQIESFPLKMILKKGIVTCQVHYLGSHKSHTLQNLKLLKGNTVMFPIVKIDTSISNEISLIFSSSKQIDILSCQLEFDPSNVKPVTPQHEGTILTLKDEHPVDDFTAFYREFNLKTDIPHSSYEMCFNKGTVTINSTNITFSVYHVGEYESFVLAKDKSNSAFSDVNRCGVIHPINIDGKHSYKLFVKSETTHHQDIPATYYHVFYGMVGKSKWNYIATVCQPEHSSISPITMNIKADKVNSHLYTRVFKYGNGWDFTDNNAYPIEKIYCESSDNFTNAKTTLDKPLYRVKMYLGGGVHTRTPNKYYTFRQSMKNIPKVPSDFSLDIE